MYVAAIIALCTLIAVPGAFLLFAPVRRRRRRDLRAIARDHSTLAYLGYQLEAGEITPFPPRDTDRVDSRDYGDCDPGFKSGGSY